MKSLREEELLLEQSISAAVRAGKLFNRNLARRFKKRKVHQFAPRFCLAGQCQSITSTPDDVAREAFFIFQASVDATGKIIFDTFEGEFQRSMGNLIAILETAGTSLSRVVQTRCYVDNGDDLPGFNRLYAAAFPAPYPARTTIGQCFRGKLKFEIDCIAIVD